MVPRILQRTLLCGLAAVILNLPACAEGRAFPTASRQAPVPNATLALPDGLSDDKPVAETDSITIVSEKNMVVGYAVCGLVMLGGFLLFKAVARGAKHASDDAVEGIFGPLTSPNGAD